MYSEVSTLEERVLTALLWGTAGAAPGAAEAAGCSRPVPCRSTPPESSITTTQAAASRAEARGTRALRRTGTAQSLRWMRETIRSST